MSAEAIKPELLASKAWSKQEKANVQLLADFVQTFNDHDFDKINKDYADHRYLQHNWFAEDGIAGFTKSMQQFLRVAPDLAYDVKYIVASNDIVTFHSHITRRAKHRGNDKKGMNVVDTWRIENGKIVEHWDAVQPLDFTGRLLALFTGGQRNNNNPRF